MKTILNVKTDPLVKRGAQRVAQDLGLSLSTVVNAYLKQFIKNKEFYLSAAPSMSPELEKLLGTIDKDIQKGKNLSREVSSSQGLKLYLASL